MFSERYQKEVEDLTAYFAARLPACGPIELTTDERKAGVDSLKGLPADLVKASFTEWLLTRNYELSYNQTCCAFFAALDGLKRTTPPTPDTVLVSREWQPIETPPDHENEVLVLVNSDEMEIGFWRDDAKAFDSYHIGWLKDATHWMPLPDPPYTKEHVDADC